MIVEIGEKATEKGTIIGVEKNSEGLNEINEKGGGCLIAAAAYGTELAPQVQFLREIRDNTLMSTSFDATFVTGFNQIYYSFSSSVANLERENEIFKDKVRFAITQMISTLPIMSLAEEVSEAQVLGFGILVLALNLGIYVVIPLMIGFKINKYLKTRN